METATATTEVEAPTAVDGTTLACEEFITAVQLLVVADRLLFSEQHGPNRRKRQPGTEEPASLTHRPQSFDFNQMTHVT